VPVDQGDVSGTYTDVDRSADPQEAAAWMDRVAGYPGFRESKARSIELLAGAGAVLDVGCGLGAEVRSLGASAVGVDPSRTMLREAAARGGRFVLATGADLPFRPACFGAARADRVLQHVPDPDRVVAEVVAAVAVGGRVVVIDPDQATLRIDGPEPELARVVERFRIAGIRNGFLPGRMEALLASSGCRPGGQERFPLVLTRPEDAFGLLTWASMLRDRGQFTAAQAATFDRTLRRSAESGSFRYSIDLALTWAEVAARSSVGGGDGHPGIG
jgi:SAM-dependent methyltransferase